MDIEKFKWVKPHRSSNSERGTDTETRKVQITGGSSFVVTIPKEWAKAQNLKKNDPVGMITQPDGNLLLTSNIKGEERLMYKTFNIKEEMEPDYLLRLLIGAYIAGYNIVSLNVSKRTMPMCRTVVRDYIQMTIGQEIVEETGSAIIIKDLLNPAEMPFDKTSKRMFIIVKSMHEDVITSLIQGNLSLNEEVRARDMDVDRLHWLIARQYNLLLRNVGLIEKMGIDVETATKYYLASRIMERIGDHGVRIARYARNLIEKKVSKNTIEKIREASAASVALFNTGMDAFFRMDLATSNRNIAGVAKVETLCDEINGFALKYKGKIALSISSIAGSIRRVGEYSVNISEVVINHIVAQPDD